jgi:hypothetical protein
LGTFALKEAKFEAGRWGLHFDVDGNPGLIDGKLEAGVLHGNFRVGDDEGTIELRRVGEPKPLASTALLNLSTQQWREDLQFLARELPKRHGNAFHRISHKQFEAAVADLDRRLDRLDGDEVYVGLNQIATLVGDAHTYVNFPPDKAALPLGFEQFNGECRVVRVAPGLEQALGARVVRVQDTPIAETRKILQSMTPGGETPELGQARVTYFLTLGLALHGFGITPDRTKARLTLTDPQRGEFIVNVNALRPGDKTQWVPAYKEAPLYQQRPGQDFWYVYLADSSTVYCCFRGYQDLATHARGLLTLIEERRPDKLILDLRQNGGGDYEEGLKYLIDPIRDLASINKKGHLFVLIGVRTFSAAMSNAAHFRSRTAAILVGEAIGERPNSYQEVRQMMLPNSRLVVRYSTQYYKFVDTDENVLRPDQEIVPSWEAYQAGQDPVLEWALKYQAK